MSYPKVFNLTTAHEACGISEYTRFQYAAVTGFDPWIGFANDNFVGRFTDEKFDLVHLQWAGGVYDRNALVRLRALCRNLNVPFLATYHNSAEELVTYEPDRIFVHSTSDTGEFFNRGYPVSKTVVIPHAVPNLVRFAPYDLGIWAACGFLLPHKGFYEFLEVFRDLHTEDPRNFRELLLFCPVHPPNERQSNELAGKMLDWIRQNDAGYVRLVTGFLPLEELAHELSRARAIIYPYLSGANQASSAALTMAYGLGRPAITSDLGLFGSDLRGRMIFPLGNWSFLKLTLRESLRDETYRELVVGSHEVARERDWKTVGARIGEVYREVLGQGPSAAASSAAARWRERKSVLPKPNVLLVAGGDVPFSFSHVNRELACALSENDLARVEVRGLGRDHRPGMEFLEVPLPFVDVEVRHTFPPKFDDWQDDDRLKALFLSWETTYAPLAWAASCQKIDRIFVFSPFSVMALENSGVSLEKIKVLPLACDHSIFRPDGPRMDLGEKTTVFLHTGTFDDRKGTIELVSAYLDAFNGGDDVLLVLKNNSFGPRYQPRIEQMRAARANPPLINYVEHEISSFEMAKIMRSCTVGVFPYKAEGGFGLPALEILACGRPVAVSHFGAPLGHVNLVNGWWLPGQTVPSTFSSSYHEEHPAAQWFRPDHDALVSFLRCVHEQRDEVEAKAKLCVGSVENYTWKKTAKTFAEVIRADLEGRLG